MKKRTKVALAAIVAVVLAGIVAGILDPPPPAPSSTMADSWLVGKPIWRGMTFDAWLDNCVERDGASAGLVGRMHRVTFPDSSYVETEFRPHHRPGGSVPELFALISHDSDHWYVNEAFISVQETRDLGAPEPSILPSSEMELMNQRQMDCLR